MTLHFKINNILNSSCREVINKGRSKTLPLIRAVKGSYKIRFVLLFIWVGIFVKKISFYTKSVAQFELLKVFSVTLFCHSFSVTLFCNAFLSLFFCHAFSVLLFISCFLYYNFAKCFLSLPLSLSISLSLSLLL